MFDQLFFRNSRALARQQAGPLAEERRRYLAYCAEQQMSASRLQHIARTKCVSGHGVFDRRHDHSKPDGERRRHDGRGGCCSKGEAFFAADLDARVRK